MPVKALSNKCSLCVYCGLWFSQLRGSRGKGEFLHLSTVKQVIYFFFVSLCGFWHTSASVWTQTYGRTPDFGLHPFAFRKFEKSENFTLGSGVDFTEFVYTDLITGKVHYSNISFPEPINR